MAVVWMPRGEHTPQRQLVNAMSAFVNERYIDAIIPANVAVESVVTPLVRQVLIVMLATIAYTGFSRWPHTVTS